MEIASPGTRNYDLIRKKNKYIAAGVREYWIIDIKNDKVVTYSEKNPYMSSIYPLEGEPGVDIYDGDLKIYFDELKDFLDEYR